MSTPLPTRLRERLEFDEGELMKRHEKIKYGIRWQTTFTEQFLAGCNNENARLAPLHEILIECVDAANEYFHFSTPDNCDVLGNALSRLSEALK